MPGLGSSCSLLWSWWWSGSFRSFGIGFPHGVSGRVIFLCTGFPPGMRRSARHCFTPSCLQLGCPAVLIQWDKIWNCRAWLTILNAIASDFEGDGLSQTCKAVSRLPYVERAQSADARVLQICDGIKCECPGGKGLPKVANLLLISNFE